MSNTTTITTASALSMIIIAIITMASLPIANAFAAPHLLRPTSPILSNSVVSITTTRLRSTTIEEASPSTAIIDSATTAGNDVNKNVEQIKNTSRDEVMTFSYDMSLEPKYDKPAYPGTGNGLSGDAGAYDIVVVGSGMGGLSCAALSAKYGSSVLCLESHVKVGGSAHTFGRVHDGGTYSFEVGPSIFEGLDRPSLNPLRMIFDVLEETMPVKTYKGLG